MPYTLGAAFDDAVAELRAATRALPDIARPGQVRTLLFEVRSFFGVLRSYPDTFARDATSVPGSTTTMGRALADIRTCFSSAELSLAEAHRQSVALSGPAGEPGHQLQRAEISLRVSQDLLNSHRGPDGEPLSPYLHVLATAQAQRYVFRRLTDLAWETGHLTEALSRRSDNPGVAAALSDARRAMHQGVVLGRQANQGVMPEFGELPLLPPLTVGPTEPIESMTVPERIAQDCDRLVRAIFETARGNGPVLSGSDLQQIGTSFAFSHLATGRTLLHVAGELPDTMQQQLRRTAGALREAAQRWQHTTHSFHRIVDIADPRERPALPRYTSTDVRAGRANPMPRAERHRATSIAERLSTSLGHLLYGEQWQPSAPRPTPRTAREITSEIGGTGALIRALHQPLSVAQYLTDAGPHLLERARHTLVTDSADHRPPAPARRQRWYPASERQLDLLLDAIHSITPAVDTAAAALIGDARTFGTDLPRARLDATTRRLYRPGPPERTVPQVAGINAPAEGKPSRPTEPRHRQRRIRRDIDAELVAALQRPRRPEPAARPRSIALDR
ncbi:hypothetical protein [Streptomyces johnsoniae]|uniref:Uncharacterized protein n=1 Tax=Streptomyces johnsoniae TaxID=3075532 RepID=A0ABU2SCU9_9ACTN|nr:hypothetical protein [Streptomyces sp. DSM 41886]MDT0446807.1 hypothetical protein [Streptomyces sp. DSM 41886]